ncbi:putative replicase [actinidia virus B]|uniref:Replicase n=1 Tax=actinidia virus B TaxID=3240218 RepID=G8H9D4_9VIRU|nr:ORF1 gene product [Actinidia virus B]AET36890.1 putative replicase [Actinidia virus B]
MSISVSSQRMAAASLMQNGSTVEIESIKTLKTERLKKCETRSDGLFDYYVSDFLRDYLAKKGVHTSVHSFQAHAHPFSKMIENHLLYNIMSQYIEKTTLFMSFKGSKIKKLLLNHKSGADLKNLKCYNRLVHIKDHLRYTDPHKELDMAHLPELARLSETCETAVIHDEVQYWSLQDFQLVLGQMNKVKRLMYSIIYPAEIDQGYEHSLFPEAYHFERRGGYFIWLPDGQSDGAYKQPINPWLLSTSKTIDSRGRTWTIGKVTSFASHHLFVASLGSTITEDEYTYDDYTVIPRGALSSGRRDYSGMYLRSRYVQAVLLYLMALKKPDSSSAVAKMRQLTNGDENPAESLFMAQIARQLQDAKLYDSMGTFNLKEAVWNGFCGALGDSITYLIDKEQYKVSSMEKFILRCSSARITITRTFRDYQPRRTKLGPELGTSWTGEEDEELQEIYHVVVKEGDRERTPYSLKGDEILDNKERRSDLMIQCARMDLLENTKELPSINEPMVFSPIDGFRSMRRFMIREGPIRGFSGLAIGWENDPNIRLKEGRITHEQYENIISGTKQATKKQMGQITKCPCGAELKRTKVEGGYIRSLIPGWTDQLQGRKAAFYSRHSEEYSYPGGSHKTRGWPAEIERMRNELGLGEDFDHCLCQIYEKGAGIPYHADDETCYKEPSVVTVNLFGEADFKTKCTNELSFRLTDGDVLTMGKGFQSNHKHSVQNTGPGRVSLTFRNSIISNQADEDDLSEYEETEAGFDETLVVLEKNVKNLCCLDRIAEHMGVKREVCASIIHSKMPRAIEEFKEGGMSISTFIHVVKQLDLACYIQNERGNIQVPGKFRELKVSATGEHMSAYLGPTATSTLATALDFNPDVSRLSIEVTQSRAIHLLESFREGFTGVNLNKYQKRPLGTDIDNTLIDVYGLFGFAGSGKSYYPQTLLRCCNMKDTLVIVPRKALKADWSEKVKDGAIVRTFESAFNGRKGYENIIIDEVGLLPPGYIDLVHANFQYDTMLLLGDPLQSEYYNKGDSLFLEPISESVFDRLMGKKNYLYKTHRLPSNQKLFDVPSKGERSENYLKGAEGDANYDLIITASRAAKEKRGQKGSTIGESQGLSVRRVKLVIDRDWGLLNDKAVMVALTRARNTLSVEVDKSMKEHLKVHAKSSILKMFLRGQMIKRELIMEMMGTDNGDVELIEKETRFADSDDMEDKLSGDPYLKGLLRLYDDVEMEEEEVPDVSLPEPQKTHLPISTKENELAPSLLRAREHREARTPAGTTEQIDEMGYKMEPENPMTHKALYLHHRNSDVATFFLSVKKRLRFMDREKNHRRFNKVKGFGKQLFKVLKETYNLRQPDKLPDLDRIEAEFARKRLNKSKNLIEKHSYRSDPDWPSHYLKIFLKQQVCTKMEKRGVDAKAGQTIACFCHAVLCKFGPLLRRTEKALRAQLGDNVLIYSQLNYTDLDKWCKNFVPSMLGTDSDYEAFDRSQDERILDFEMEVLKFFLWPEEVINEYKELKLMMGSSMGSLAVMRFSGEFGTFFFNTICNMAFTCLRYKINKDTPICYAGDDMYAPGHLIISKEHEGTLDQLSLKAKVRVSTEPLFCGWRMSPYGIVKDPNLLLDRWKIAKRGGNLDQCMVNYSLEACYGYRLGEYLFDINIDIDAQQELVREIIKIKHKLPKGIRKLFSSDPTECGSDGEELEFRVRNEGGIESPTETED